MTDLFYECEDSNVASYADDTTPYSCATDIPSVALELQASASNTAKNTVISRNFLVWKFCGKKQCPQSFR